MNSQVIVVLLCVRHSIRCCGALEMSKGIQKLETGDEEHTSVAFGICILNP